MDTKQLNGGDRVLVSFYGVELEADVICVTKSGVAFVTMRHNGRVLWFHGESGVIRKLEAA